ncbi:MAG: hypothetical protein ACRD9L_24315 [Bryobacteraceae bacterium]
MQIKETENDVTRRQIRPLWVVTLCAVILLLVVIAIAVFRDHSARERGVDPNPHPLVTTPGSTK